ncbi:glycosyltransferase [Facklamia sp. P12934]|uniref:glycosyltransferase n=1 Tax=Facklamia sp. P12934 TaxID=3421948 RepID=UPI003D17CB7E
MKKFKILYTINWLNYGGAERFVLNILQHFDLNKFDITIMIRNNPNPMIDSFEDLGVKIVQAPAFPKEIYKHVKFLIKFIFDNKNRFDFIHMHLNSLIYILPIILFKMFSKKTKIIIHSHSSFSKNSLVRIIHKINKLVFLNFIDLKIGCSKNAGDWMFNEKEFFTLYNGIDIERFSYNKDFRKEIRDKFNLNDRDILIGIVGRLSEVKNHKFALDLLEKLEENFKLMIIGDGELECEIKKYIKSKSIDDKVIMTGAVNDVNKYYSALDIFIQPSLFEGFPFTVIESQVANLPTLISNNITEEVKFSDKVYFLDLDNRVWLKTLKAIASKTSFKERNIYFENNFSDINIKEISRKLTELYIKEGTL